MIKSKNYSRVTTSAAKVFQNTENVYNRHHEHGSVMIQNDVWVGKGASFMSGVTVHNGAIVAAMSHVVKDVPPYAIVGGNPARVIGYRFDEEIIRKLQMIQWWYWSIQKIEENAKWFNDDIERFCDYFYDEARIEVERICKKSEKCTQDRYFMLIDDTDYYSVTPEVIDNFLLNFSQTKGTELILYKLSDDEMDEQLKAELYGDNIEIISGVDIPIFA